MKFNKETLYWSRGCLTAQSKQGETCCKSVGDCHKLTVFDWLKEIPADKVYNIFEVRFKNTRKNFYRDVNNLGLKEGDIVAVETSPGHDIGIISALGPVAEIKFRKTGQDPGSSELKKIYRLAKPTDIEKWQEAVSLEYPTMLRARQLATMLGLNMKIGDVEYQGDRTKAIFYYIADERVDFRELIKVLADAFKIRIEMRQIGARQEAGLIGGIGPCGRELCCAQWMTNFVSVSTNSARHQEISVNPLKLAGQCGKLKCCLNYELDTYLDALRNFPQVREPLQTLNGTFFLQKTDVLKGIMWFGSDPCHPINMTAVPVARVKEIIHLNRKGQKVDQLVFAIEEPEVETGFKSAVGEDSLTRFDKSKRSKKRSKHRQGEQSDNNRRPMAAPSPTIRTQDSIEEPKRPVAEKRENTGRNNNRPLQQREQRSDSENKNQNTQESSANTNNRTQGRGRRNRPGNGKVVTRRNNENFDPKDPKPNETRM